MSRNLFNMMTATLALATQGGIMTTRDDGDDREKETRTEPTPGMQFVCTSGQGSPPSLVDAERRCIVVELENKPRPMTGKTIGYKVSARLLVADEPKPRRTEQQKARKRKNKQARMARKRNRAS